jgi:hypothetical protein
MDEELANLIRGWVYFLAGGFVSTILIVQGFPIAAIIWLVFGLYGLLLLIAGFIKHQKPHLREYLQAYRDKVEFEVAVRSACVNTKDKE